MTPVFIAQTRNPFTVGPSNFTGVAGAGAYALLSGNPNQTGGTPNASNPSITCATQIHNTTNYFNPCAFSNPLSGSGLSGLITTTAQAIQYLGTRSNQIYGPGYNRLNASVFKNFPTFEGQYLQFRMDVFNFLNHPAWGQPNGNDGNTGGLISNTRSTGKDTPDARFFQFALKYYF